MISVIICSRKHQISDHLRKNIGETIGTDFEIVVIDNSTNKLAICEAYNQGVMKSSGSILCFMHDDINFHTSGWGKKVHTHFEDHNVGAIGVAGSAYAARTSGPWWGAKLLNINIVGNEKLVAEGNFTLQTKSRESVILDGLWICIRKSLFPKIQFDSTTFKGYHFYDVDISLQIIQNGQKMLSIYDVLIEHHSIGDVNQHWIKESRLLSQKWKKKLPISCLKLTIAKQNQAEFKTLSDYTRILIDNKHTETAVYRFALSEILKRRNILVSPQYFTFFFVRYLQAVSKHLYNYFKQKINLR